MLLDYPRLKKTYMYMLSQNIVHALNRGMPLDKHDLSVWCHRWTWRILLVAHTRNHIYHIQLSH